MRPQAHEQGKVSVVLAVCQCLHKAVRQFIGDDLLLPGLIVPLAYGQSLLVRLVLAVCHGAASHLVTLHRAHIGIAVGVLGPNEVTHGVKLVIFTNAHVPDGHAAGRVVRFLTGAVGHGVRHAAALGLGVTNRLQVLLILSLCGRYHAERLRGVVYLARRDRMMELKPLGISERRAVWVESKGDGQPLVNLARLGGDVGLRR